MYIYKVGDIISDSWEVISIDNYKNSSRKRYELKCLKCGKISGREVKSILNNTTCKKCSRNVFYKSKDGDYWIGITQSGIEFMFNGDEPTISYIKGLTWRINRGGYVQNKIGEKLHRVIMGVDNPSIFVNHVGGNRLDCRKENLSISNCLDNSKEKVVSSRNNSGIVGLMARGKYKNRWVGNVKIGHYSVYSKYKDRDEALIDLLIMQRHYGFRHNVSMYYMLDNVSQDRIDEVIDNCERQMKKDIKHNIKSSNRYELSECKTFYWVYDDDESKPINKFKIDLDSIHIIHEGKWHVAYDNNHSKLYVHGCIIIDGKRKSVKLHRHLLGLNDNTYKTWFIDHFSGDSLDNRLSNLHITNAIGNGHKANGTNIIKRHIRKDGVVSYRARTVLGGITYDKTFYSEKEAEQYIQECKELFAKNRLSFKSKNELDLYRANKEITNGN